MSVAAAATLLDVRPVAGALGAEVRGVDLRTPLGAVGSEIRGLLAHHGVLFFPHQAIGCDEHRGLALALGEPKAPPDYIPTLEAEGYPEIAVISTDNQLAYMSDRWHSDVTWEAGPPMYSILHMQEVPATGGDTMWASQHRSYETLSAPMRAFLEHLTARHELPGQPERGADHPVVCRHPVTGRRALFVNSVFTAKINELSAVESHALLTMLFAHSTRPELTCRWRWTPGDVAIWDNHFVQHYAIYDYGTARRRIHRIEIRGEPPVPVSPSMPS